MSILNVNQIQPVGSGQTVTISAANITASSSTISASSFVGGVTVTSGNLTGISSVSTTNLTVNGNAYPSAGPLSNRNLIINGAMVFDQRNSGSSVTPTANTYVLDRWHAISDASSKYSVQQVSDAPAGFSFSQKATSLSAYTPASNELFGFWQWIEGFNSAQLEFGTASAKTITVSFWVKSSLTGTFGGGILNSGYTRGYPFEYTISSANTWEYKTVTIAGDTSGTWIGATNGQGLLLNFTLGAGSARSNTAGAWSGTQYSFSSTGAVNVVSTNAATWQITGVQLEVGTVATPFEHRNISDELYRCRRYYQKSYPHNIAPGNVTSGQRAGDFTFLEGGNTTVAIMLRFEPEMRALPTVTTYSFHNANTANKVTASTTDYTSSTNSAVNSASRYIITATGVTAADDVYCAYTAEAEL